MVIEPAISSASLGRRSWYGHRFRADAARIRDLQGVTDGFPDFRNGLIDALLHDELHAFAVDLQGERVGDVQISVGRKADGGDVIPAERRDETSTAVMSQPCRQAVEFVPAAASRCAFRTSRSYPVRRSNR